MCPGSVLQAETPGRTQQWSLQLQTHDIHSHLSWMQTRQTRRKQHCQRLNMRRMHLQVVRWNSISAARPTAMQATARVPAAIPAQPACSLLLHTHCTNFPTLHVQPVPI